MKLLINDIGELKKHVPVQHTDHGFRLVEPFLYKAQKMYLKPVIGRDLMDVLLELATPADDSGEESGSGSGGGGQCADVKSEALDMARKASGWLALYLGFSQLELNLSLEGFTQAMKDRPAIFSGQRTDAKIDLLMLGVDEVEDLLEHLEENKTCFSDWAESDARTDMLGHILPTAKVFTQYWNKMANKRLTYMALRTDMIDVEETQVRAILGDALFSQLMGQLTGEVSAANKELLRFLRPMVAKMTALKAMPGLQLRIEAYGVFSWFTEKNEKNSEVLSPPKGHVVYQNMTQLERESDMHREDLITYLQDNVASYPLFKQSKKYVAPVTTESYPTREAGCEAHGGARSLL